MHLVARSDMNDMAGRLVEALKQVVGAYSLVALTETRTDRRARSLWACARWCWASWTAPMC